VLPLLLLLNCVAVRVTGRPTAVTWLVAAAEVRCLVAAAASLL